MTRIVVVEVQGEVGFRSRCFRIRNLHVLRSIEALVSASVNPASLRVRGNRGTGSEIWYYSVLLVSDNTRARTQTGKNT